jgi:hypothetical protein
MIVTQKAEGRKQKAEGGKQKAESRKQKAESNSYLHVVCREAPGIRTKQADSAV